MRNFSGNHKITMITNGVINDKIGYNWNPIGSRESMVDHGYHIKSGEKRQFVGSYSEVTINL